MKHTFYKQLRKARTRQRAALRAGEADAQADPHAVFERESLYRAALAEIGRMKPKQRDVVVLRLFSGCPSRRSPPRFIFRKTPPK